MPQADGEKPGERLRVRAEQAARLEGWIDEHNQDLESLRQFVLPSGTALSAWAHQARSAAAAASA
ncbi:MAG: ATP:cob(I)alamin adenosyltransferase [Gemmataceae bacterium]